MLVVFSSLEGPGILFLGHQGGLREALGVFGRPMGVPESSLVRQQARYVEMCRCTVPLLGAKMVQKSFKKQACFGDAFLLILGVQK